MAVAGWDAMCTSFGCLPFSQLFAPAIYCARNGLPWAERNSAPESQKDLSSSESAWESK